MTPEEVKECQRKVDDISSSFYLPQGTTSLQALIKDKCSTMSEKDGYIFKLRYAKAIAMLYLLKIKLEGGDTGRIRRDISQIERKLHRLL